MLAPITDGVVTLRPPRDGDGAILIAGRDHPWRRGLGPGGRGPRPPASVRARHGLRGCGRFHPPRGWAGRKRESWEAMTPVEQRAHALKGLQGNHDAFGSGPKWTFAVDAVEAPNVAYVDCDLANEHVPAGEANISYSSHPSHRGRGH